MWCGIYQTKSEPCQAHLEPNILAGSHTYRFQFLLQVCDTSKSIWLAFNIFGVGQKYFALRVNEKVVNEKPSISDIKALLYL